jgi:S-(hydroxymethyl)glutathione synthase
MTVKIHPAVDNGVKAGTPGFAGGTLTCKCTTDPVKVSIEGDVLFNHVCGCSQCWRPTGTLFSMIAVVPTPKVKVLANGHKLKVVDPTKTIQRNACTVCGVHMHGPINNPKHAFNGLTFVHAERSTRAVGRHRGLRRSSHRSSRPAPSRKTWMRFARASKSSNSSRTTHCRRH